MRRTLLTLPLAPLLALLLALPLASAQEEDVDAFVEQVLARAEAVQDSSFLAVGELIDLDGTRIALELEIQLVPPANVASVYVLQPDALADNVIVLQGDTVYNYTFLTHQITIFAADDPDALGGLLGGDDDEVEVELTFDLGRLLDGYDAAWNGEEDTPYGPARVVRLVNREPGARFAELDVVVPLESLLPYAFRVYAADGTMWATVRGEELVLDQGLAASEVAYLPEDAERIDLRD